MKRHALLVILLGAIALLVTALAPPGGAVAQTQPTMVVSPASGPCDATVEVKGTGFPVGPGQAKSLDVYLLQPGSTDVAMTFLVPGYPDQQGVFSQWAGLGEHGCEAAALDSQAELPTAYLAIAAAPGGAAVQPGERIPNIIAVAQYTYTTTTPPPPPVMAVSPSSGPCDATIEVTGTGFQPGQAVSLWWAYPGSEAPMGALGSVTADALGAFVVQIALGETGCGAAQAYPSARDPTPPRLRIDAEAIGPPVQVGSSLARSFYTFTTSTSGRGALPTSLPATGSGPSQPSVHVAWVPFIATLGAVGVMLVAASFCRRRVRS